MPESHPTGLLPIADRLSKIFLWGSAVAGLILAVWTVAVWLAAKHTIFPPHIQSLIVGFLVGLFLSSLNVQLTARKIRWLRKVSDRLDQPSCGYPEGFADGLARRPARTLHLVENGLDPS